MLEVGQAAVATLRSNRVESRLVLECRRYIYGALLCPQREMELRCELDDAVIRREHLLVRADESEVVLDADAVTGGETLDSGDVHGLDGECESECGEGAALPHPVARLERRVQATSTEYE